MEPLSIDPHSETWAAVKKFAETEIEFARNRLERQGADPLTTEYERGRIKTLRDLLALATPRPEIRVPSTSY